MDLQELFRKSVAYLQDQPCRFALAGGIAAQLYRHELRFTGDIDFLLSAPQAADIACTAIATFGLTPHLLRDWQLTGARVMNKKSRPVWIVSGRAENSPLSPGLDFLLEELSWVPQALDRAYQHQVNFEFATIPTITAEDIIIAKMISSKGTGERRFRDLDDISSIIRHYTKLDWAYLCAQIDNLHIVLTNEVEKLLPKAARIAAKKNRRMI